MSGKRKRTIDELALWNRFHIRLTVIYAVVTLLVLGVMSLVFYRVGVESELDGLRNRLLASAIMLANTLDVEALVELDQTRDISSPTYQTVWSQFQTICDQYPNITSLYTMMRTDQESQTVLNVDYTPDDEQPAHPGEPYDASGLPVMLRGLEEPAVEQQPWRDVYGLTMSGYAPLITEDGQKVGLVGLDLDAARVDQVKAEVRNLTLIVFGVAAVLLAALGWLVGRSMRRPLTRVMMASNQVARGDLKARVRFDRKDEFGLLGENFNSMAEGLEERDFIRETFGRYVSETVARTLLTTPGSVELGGEDREVTVLLSDLRGYSTISEELSPGQVVNLLNEYLGAMNEIIDNYQGCVIEYLGDGILAVFGAPNDIPDHAEQAVRCAIAMRNRLSDLNRKWEENGLSLLWQSKGLPELRARYGIHTGTVVAGNLGSPTRMKYAVTGDNVNIAARLEALNKRLETEILISNETREVLSEELQGRAVDRGFHHVKGREHEVHVFSL